MIPKYLPDTVNNNKKYSLVLDLDETLVHFVAKEKKIQTETRLCLILERYVSVI